MYTRGQVETEPEVSERDRLGQISRDSECMLDRYLEDERTQWLDLEAMIRTKNE